MIIALLLSFLFAGLTIVLHFWALRILTTLMPEDADHNHFVRSILILGCIFFLHFFEILYYSASYYIAIEYFDIGHFTKEFVHISRDYLYFSLVTYTTLGLSEFNPVGHLKVMTGIQSLTGFIMLTWSATFFYNLMNRKN